MVEAAPVETADAAAADAPKAEPASWYEPVPAVELAAPVDPAAARACGEANGFGRGSIPDPRQLMAAATCFGDHGHIGHEIRSYEILLQQHPMAPEAQLALRRSAELYERLGRFSDARQRWEAYMERYAADPDAFMFARRAVCLARSSGDAQAVERVLAALQRLEARFVRPSPDELAELCRRVPPPSR